jgi:hypothetical protein
VSTTRQARPWPRPCTCSKRRRGRRPALPIRPVNQSSHRTTRQPPSSPRKEGAEWKRSAERHPLGSLHQEPPRSTRVSPFYRLLGLRNYPRAAPTPRISSS